MTPRPTGRLDESGHLVLARTFRASAQEVWAALTDPDRLARSGGLWGYLM